jgi:hypothetical protein
VLRFCPGSATFDPVKITGIALVRIIVVVGVRSFNVCQSRLMGASDTVSKANQKILSVLLRKMSFRIVSDLRHQKILSGPLP